MYIVRKYKIICACFRSIWQKKIGFDASFNKFPDNVHILCLHCNDIVLTMFLNLHTKRENNWTFCLNFHFGVYCAFPVLSVSIALCFT
jgi:hypothetical protein